MLDGLKLIKNLITTHVMRLLFRVFYVFPIKKNRVLFQSFREKQYSCNPKYISQKLHEMYGDQVEIGWSFRNPEKFAYLKDQGVRVMKSRTIEFYKFALTAKVVCVNTYYKPTLPRRKGQYFIRTWHGGGAYKRVGRMEKLPALKRWYLALQQEGADLYLSSSKAFTDLTLHDSFGYFGEIFEYGMPRNDILVNGAPKGMIDEVRKEIGLKEDERLVLYAPTFRYNTKLDSFGLDYRSLTDALSERFGGKWKCAYRGHHVTFKTDHTKSAEGAIDLTDYPDMQKLLLAADVLVTDYSSCIWDMSLMKKPAFLFAPDLKAYTSERDFYTDIHSWPFPLSESNAELKEVIMKFDQEKYISAVDRHHEELGSYETGHAGEMAAKRIFDVMTKG